MMINLFKKLIYEPWGLIYDIPGYLKIRGIRNGDVVLDLGAYTGLFTLYAAKKVGSKGKVVAFEPEPYNYDILKKRTTGLDNVALVKKGVFNKNGDAKIVTSKLRGSLASKVQIGKIPGKFDMFSKIKICKLDSELPKQNIRKVDFIKMDIEGAELEAIDGAERILKKYLPFLAIACYHQREGASTKDRVIEKLKKIGYKNFKVKNLLHATLFAS